MSWEIQKVEDGISIKYLLKHLRVHKKSASLKHVILLYTAYWSMREEKGRGQLYRDTSSSCNVLSFGYCGSCTSLMISSLHFSNLGPGGVIGLSGTSAIRYHVEIIATLVFFFFLIFEI